MTCLRESDHDSAHEGMSQNHFSVTYPSQITPAGVDDCSQLDAGAKLILHRVLVDIGVINISEAQLLIHKSLRERSV